MADVRAGRELSMDDVYRLLGERDLAIMQLSKEVGRLRAEAQRLQAEAATETTDGAEP